MTVEQFAEDMTSEYDESGVITYTLIEDNLDLIFENFIQWSKVLDKDVYDEFIMRLEDPTTVYHQRVSDFSQKQRKAIMRAVNPELDQTLRGDFEDIEYFENIDTSKLPVFNTSWLPYDFQKFADALAECLQISPDMSGVPVLIIASSAIQKKYQVNPKPGWHEPLNLYAAIVAEPSERKSQTQRAVTNPVYMFEREENERIEPEISQFETKKNLLEGRIKYLTGQIVRGKKRNEVQEADLMELKRELDDLQEVSTLRLIADDTTSEALVRLLKQNNERMSIISSEGGIFQIMAGLYNNDKSNIDIYLKAYSGDPVSVDRKISGSDSLQHPALTVLLFVQNSIINEIMDNKEFRGRGLLARFLYVFPKSLIGNRKYLVDDIPEWISDNYEMAVRRLLEIAIPTNPGIIKYTDGAFKLAESFFYEIEKQLPDNLEEIKDWAGKFHGQTMRIAGVLHCMEHFEKSDQVLLNENTMRNAIEMGRYFFAHAKAAFDIMGITEPQQVKDAKYILKKIDSLISQNTQNTQNINKRNLQQICRGHFPISEDMEPGLNELVERNYIRIGKIQTGKAGRPTEIVYVNPEYINYLKEKQPGNNIAGGYENIHNMENMEVDSESERHEYDFDDEGMDPMEAMAIWKGERKYE